VILHTHDSLDFVIEFTVDSFLGHERPEIHVQKHRGGDKSKIKSQLKDQQAFLSRVLGKTAAKDRMADDLQAQKERASRRTTGCTFCQKQQQVGEKFKSCARCQDRLQRDVPYCSP
jgi:hypothetical protein